MAAAEAVNPETLLMPGKLSAAHAKYEENLEAPCTHVQSGLAGALLRAESSICTARSSLATTDKRTGSGS
jgi:hypothetical protein